MAKRYIRINWQNRPNVATPLSAANLNKMDKGIDDIDNAIEEIYNKRVNNVVTTNPDTFLAGPVGKTLQDQIDVLNNNLANKIGSILTGSVFDITTTGIWYCGDGVADKPTSNGGMLLVAYGSADNIVYTFIPINPDSYSIYRCVVRSGIKSDWMSK